MNIQSASRDFYIGGFLVAILLAIGFFRFPTSPGVSTYIGLTASIAITIAYFLRHGWARFAAILAGIFGIIGELQQIQQPAAISSMAFYFVVVFWLSRKTVKSQFKSFNATNTPNKGA